MTGLPEGVTHWEGPGLDAWEAWTPWEAHARLRGVTAPWCVVGGWAIDLFLGRSTRPHEDLEIAILRADLPAVRTALHPLELFSVGNGEVRALAADEAPPRHKHQNWVLDREANAWRADVMLEPGDPTTWVFRRDESIQAERSFMVQRTPDGVPFLAPHGVLLFKAKAARAKDEADLANCLDHLEEPSRTWLAEALHQVHPGHPWIEQLR